MTWLWFLCLLPVSAHLRGLQALSLVEPAEEAQLQAEEASERAKAEAELQAANDRLAAAKRLFEAAQAAAAAAPVKPVDPATTAEEPPPATTTVEETPTVEEDPPATTTVEEVPTEDAVEEVPTEDVAPVSETPGVDGALELLTKIKSVLADESTMLALLDEKLTQLKADATPVDEPIAAEVAADELPEIAA